MKYIVAAPHATLHGNVLQHLCGELLEGCAGPDMLTPASRLCHHQRRMHLLLVPIDTLRMVVGVALLHLDYYTKGSP